jgi:hypothetical protein
MAFSAVKGTSRPALAYRLTLSLGLVALAVGLIFSAIYFVLSISLFSRLANQELEQKAKSADIIVRAVAHSKEATNSSTFIRNLQKAGFNSHIGVFSPKLELMAHTDESISEALSKIATDPKLKLRLVEEQHKLAQTVIAYNKKQSQLALYRADDLHYVVVKEADAVVLVALAVNKPKLLTLAASFLLLCLLAVGINLLFIYHYGHSLAHTIAQIVRGLDVDSLRIDSINPQYLEIEALIHGVDEKIRQSRAPVVAAAAPVAVGPNIDSVLQLMQTRLFERPFPRMDKHELAVYPRRPKLETREFISGSHEAGRTDVLIGITDSDSPEALVIKHRLQERFLALAKEHLTSDDMARNLWAFFAAHGEFVPGLFFARFDEHSESLDIFRAGGVHLFEVLADGACNAIHVGDDSFGSEYTMITEHRLTPGGHFVMVSNDAFSTMELSPDDFAELLARLGKARTGKILLAGILEKIHQKLAAGETVPGLLAVLSEKK